jgi:hypothetical protein
MSDNPMLPNSFQTPNIYVDDIMYLLTPEEYMVLSYACRRIFGFRKRQDHISLSQFTDGTTSKASKLKLDHGTGLNKMTVQKAIASLKQYGLLIEITPPDKLKNIAAEYSLQEDIDQVDFLGLEIRYAKRHKDRNPGKRPGRKQAPQEPDPDMSQGDMNPMLSHSIGSEPGLSDSTPPMLSHSIAPGLSHSRTKIRGKSEENKDREANASTPRPSKEFMDNSAVIAYRNKFNLTPRIEQRRTIAETVLDLTAWEVVLDAWTLNGKTGYDPFNVGDMLSRYKREVEYKNRKVGQGKVIQAGARWQKQEETPAALNPNPDWVAKQAAKLHRVTVGSN